MQKEKTITSAEKGTAMHMVMQHLPMTNPLISTEIKELLEALIAKEILTKQEAGIIDVQAIEQFYTTDIAKLMMGNPSLHREVPFSLTIPASKVYAKWTGETDENVLIQGVIDCLIPKDDGWIILDYKTDAINEEVSDSVKEKLVKRYETQMELYRHAIEQIWKQPVQETYLYFFSKKLLVRVPVE